MDDMDNPCAFGRWYDLCNNAINLKEKNNMILEDVIGLCVYIPFESGVIEARTSMEQWSSDDMTPQFG